MIFKTLFKCAKERLTLCRACSSRLYSTSVVWKGTEDFLKIHPDVKKALSMKRPVVALESTIITHGMPYPQNYQTALEVEDIVKQKSVTPATIAVIDGFVHVGLFKDDLHKLSTATSARKISRRGLPASITFRQTGGTTVSATMLIAHRCNIPIFVTGGIGGVHRGSKNTMDISSDLMEFGRTPITVISAGVKSILDIPKTLEYLETQGVTVATFGKNKDFPAFFTPISGCESQICLKNSSQAAELIKASQNLNMDSGCLIAVPIPKEHAASGESIESAIKRSLAETESQSITGADVTPYVLKRVNELTGGESLKANVALIKNNASVGADIAVELARNPSRTEKQTVIASTQSTNGKINRLVVIGATNIDVIAKCTSEILFDGPSNQANVSYALGGVGRNIAEGLARYGDNPAFISALGDDGHAIMAEREMEQYLDMTYIEKIQECGSGVYNAIMDSRGLLKLAVERMEINDRMTVDVLSKHEDLIAESPLVCVDANMPIKTLHYICDLCKSNSVDLFFESTGSLKAVRPFTDKSSWKSIKYLSPNIQEFEVIMSAVTGKDKKINLNENGKFAETTLKSIHEACRPLLDHVYCLIVTLAGKGVATFTQDDSPAGLTARHYPLTSIPQFDFMSNAVVNVSGSGDAFAAAFIHGLLLKKSVDVCTKMGLIAAQFSLRSKNAVPSALNVQLFDGMEDLPWDFVSL